jgi:hypothetical protein
MNESCTLRIPGGAVWSLCMIWGSHGGDYEEWRLLGYKNPVKIVHQLVTADVPDSHHGGDVPPKRPFLQEAHGITSQKTVFFILEQICK